MIPSRQAGTLPELCWQSSAATSSGCKMLRQGFCPLACKHCYCCTLLILPTSAGALYTVDVEGRAVENVAQLQNAAVAALAAHDGFTVTGSAGRLLRVWGSNLRGAYMEAQHEGPVTGGAAILLLRSCLAGGVPCIFCQRAGEQNKCSPGKQA
jgi:hypothetical protein